MQSNQAGQAKNMQAFLKSSFIADEKLKGWLNGSYHVFTCKP